MTKEIRIESDPEVKKLQGRLDQIEASPRIDETFLYRKSIVDQLIAEKKLVISVQHQSAPQPDGTNYDYVSWRISGPGVPATSGISDSQVNMIEDIYVALEYSGYLVTP